MFPYTLLLISLSFFTLFVAASDSLSQTKGQCYTRHGSRGRRLTDHVVPSRDAAIPPRVAHLRAYAHLKRPRAPTANATTAPRASIVQPAVLSTGLSDNDDCQKDASSIISSANIASYSEFTTLSCNVIAGPSCCSMYAYYGVGPVTWHTQSIEVTVATVVSMYEHGLTKRAAADT